MKILVLEDDREIASLVQTGLANAGFEVDVAADGHTGLAMAKMTESSATRSKYDAAIVDLMLPGRDGLSVITELRHSNLDLPVLILSAKRSVDDRISGLQSGGDDYLTKPFVFAELLARVQALLRRANKVTDSLLSSTGLTLDLISRELKRGEQRLTLQPKEFALMEFFMKHQDEVLTKAQILKKVWDYNFDPQTNVVDVLVCRLRTKIEETLGLKIISTIRGVGYVLRSI